MNPKKINTFHATIADIDKEEVGTYYSYDGLPTKVGDLVILEIYPNFEDVQRYFEYTDRYPPEYLVLAEVIKFNGGEFLCKVLTEDSQSSTQR